MVIGGNMIRIRSCASTNDLARELALAGEAEGTVVVAEEQTAGKGTKGRTWFSPRGKGLYLSVILYPSRPDVSLLPLVAGLAAREAIFASFRIRVGLKWPNDLLWEGKKLAGILCESSFKGNRMTHAVLGIGLNVSHEQEDFPPELRAQAISLKKITPVEVDSEALLESLCPALDRWYGRFLEGRSGDIIRAFEEGSVLCPGKKVTLLVNGEEVRGTYRGLDSRGGLELEVGGRRKTFFSAEITSIKE